MVAAFEALVERVQACYHCPGMHHVHVLSRRNGPVPAPVMFIGEAVGRLGGARTGVPMSRDATGKRFNALLTEAGIARERVFITNAVLCNPLRDGRNRRPQRAELVACAPFLGEQLQIVSPQIIVTLGEIALSALRFLLPHDYQLRRCVGQALPWGGRILVPLYHPGPRAEVHRARDLQVMDWRRLGTLVLHYFPSLRADSHRCL